MRRTTIAMLLGLALVALVGCGQAILGSTANERVEHTFPLQKGGTFSLENVNGTLTVTLAKGSEVHFVAEKSAKALDQDKAKKGLSQIEVITDNKPDLVKVVTRYPKGGGFFGGSGFSGRVDYTVEVPQGTKVELTNVNGTINVNTPGSPVSCETTNGSVMVDGADLLKAAAVNGKVRFSVEDIDEVSTTNGSIEGSVRSLAPKGGKVESVNGHVELTLPGKAALRVEAENVNGGVESGFSGLSKEKHSISGDLNGGGRTISVETVNGSITIRPAGAV